MKWHALIKGVRTKHYVYGSITVGHFCYLFENIKNDPSDMVKNIGLDVEHFSHNLLDNMNVLLDKH